MYGTELCVHICNLFKLKQVMSCSLHVGMSPGSTHITVCMMGVGVCTSSSLPELDPELLECAAAAVTGEGLGRLAWDFFSPCEAGEK